MWFNREDYLNDSAENRELAVLVDAGCCHKMGSAGLRDSGLFAQG
jgi:hypothetical protein